jgi:hypothetical protein
MIDFVWILVAKRGGFMINVMYIWNEYIEQKKIQKKPLDTKGMVWLK